MKNLKKIIFLLLLAVSYYYKGMLPGEIRIVTGKKEKISFHLPFTAEIEGESVGVPPSLLSGVRRNILSF